MFIEYLLLAQDSSIDQEKNSLSVFGILEDLDIKTNLSEVHFPFQVIISIRRDKETGPIESNINLKLHPPNSQPVTQSLPFKMNSEHRRFRMRVNVAILINSSGELKCSAKLPDESSPPIEMIVNLKFQQAK